MQMIVDDHIWWMEFKHTLALHLAKNALPRWDADSAISSMNADLEKHEESSLNYISEKIQNSDFVSLLFPPIDAVEIDDDLNNLMFTQNVYFELLDQLMSRGCFNKNAYFLYKIGLKMLNYQNPQHVSKAMEIWIQFPDLLTPKNAENVIEMLKRDEFRYSDNFDQENACWIYTHSLIHYGFEADVAFRTFPQEGPQELNLFIHLLDDDIYFSSHKDEMYLLLQGFTDLEFRDKEVLIEFLETNNYYDNYLMANLISEFIELYISSYDTIPNILVIIVRVLQNELDCSVINGKFQHYVFYDDLTEGSFGDLIDIDQQEDKVYQLLHDKLISIFDEIISLRDSGYFEWI